MKLDNYAADLDREPKKKKKKMNFPTRFIALVLTIIVRLLSYSLRFENCLISMQLGLHFIISLTSEQYGRATSFGSLLSHITPSGSNPDPPYDPYVRPPNAQPVNDRPQDYNSTGTNSTLDPNRRANAAFVVLARNSDLEGVLSSVRQMEDRFNRYYGYPYVFLNEVPFTEKFIE